jgi:hypothetical protein
MKGVILKTSRDIRQYNMVVSPVGFGTKYHCTGEGQQQFSTQTPTNNCVQTSDQFSF